MRAYALRANEITTRAGEGWVVAEDVRAPSGRRLLRKGDVLDQNAAVRLAAADGSVIHVVEPEPGDLHENEAGRRLAEAVVGPGMRISGPAQSRYNLVATRKGVLRVNRKLLSELNRLYGVAIFSLLDRQVVLPGKLVAGVKVTPLLVPESVIQEAETLAAEYGPVLRLLPFQPKRVAVIATEGLAEKLRHRFRTVVERKIGWYGSTVTEVTFTPREAEAVADAVGAAAAGNDVVLVAGGNTLDPLDPAFLALGELGAEMIHYGAPAHPGSMFWLARLGTVPIFNLASCSMYSRATFADLVLPLVMTGQPVDSAEIAELGYGGLLDRDMAFRFPPYDVESVDEDDGEEGEGEGDEGPVGG